MNQKFLFAELFFVFILVSGFWLSRTGKPLNVIILTIHKLISLAAVIFLVITVYQIHRVAPLNPVETAASVVTLLLFIVMFATGGLLSIAKPMPGVILKIHQIMPYFGILTITATLYLLWVRKL
jgi:heme A synthase